jgi:DNA-directed RNA polymerase specialized sigma24 family protein
MGSEAPGATSDRELWQRAADGDSTAFGEIFERHAKAVYNHLFRRISDWSQAEDLTSAVFLHAWRRRSSVV